MLNESKIKLLIDGKGLKKPTWHLFDFVAPMGWLGHMKIAHE